MPCMGLIEAEQCGNERRMKQMTIAVLLEWKGEAEGLE